MKKFYAAILGCILLGASLSANAYTDENGNTNDRNTVWIKKCFPSTSYTTSKYLRCIRVTR